MSKTSNVSLLAGAAVTLGTFGNTALAVEGQAYTNADEVRSIVANMMADSDSRSSLMMQGGGGGYDDGFYLADSAGNFRLNFKGLIQFRYFLNFRDDDDNANDDSDFSSGFQNARTRLQFDGYIVDPNLFYNIELTASDSAQHVNGSGDGSFNLQRAFVGYRWDNGFHLKWGQFRTQFLREDNVRPEYQLAADRSITNSAYRQGDSQGFELGYSAEDWRLFFAFTDGMRTANTDWPAGTAFGPTVFSPITGSPVATTPIAGAAYGGEQDAAITLRVEIRFAGTWEQFEDFTSMPGSEFAAMLGFAGHYQWTDSDRVGPAGPAGIDGVSGLPYSNGDASYASWTVDLSFEGDGWNFFVAGIGGYTKQEDALTNNIALTVDDYDPNNYGIIVQGGWFIPETDWELFARYDAIFVDDDQEDIFSGRDNFNTVTFGTNWYWHGHAAKFTADVQWFIDKTNPLVGTNSLVGYTGSDGDNQFTLRFQFQLMF